MRQVRRQKGIKAWSMTMYLVILIPSKFNLLPLGAPDVKGDNMD